MTTAADVASLSIAGHALADAVRSRTQSGSDDTRLRALAVCESVSRQLDQQMVELVARLDRDGVFTERGYARPAHAVADLLGWDLPRAARLVRAAEQLASRATLDGQVLAARLPATALAFAAGSLSLRHVEVIADALGSAAASRLTPSEWSGAEEQLAEHAGSYRPRELQVFARDLVNALDQDGPVPDENESAQVNELHLTRTSSGGRIKGDLDAPTFAALATAVDALTVPTPEDRRGLPERQADALGELARRALDSGRLPISGGERPHIAVTIPLVELEVRGRRAMLDYGAELNAADLRQLACDARVIPIVLGGAGQPMDVGRAQRTVPTHLRRAVGARDRGCAFPGCDRLPSWCDVHHVKEWQRHGTTEINNLVMLCRVHHRLIHHSGWTARIRDGQPEFTPPDWIDPDRIPRRKPPNGIGDVARTSPIAGS